MRKKIKLICFDVGGTLVYHKKFVRLYKKHTNQSLFRRYEKYGIKNSLDVDAIRADHFDSKVHKDMDKAIRDYIKKIGITKNKEEFFINFKKVIIDYHKHLTYYKETKYVLNWLKKSGYKTAFITNWGQHARDNFELIGLSKYADHMLISAEHGKRKPHPSLFKEVLKIFKVKPSEALMIGDKYEKDYLPAISLGMRALLINRKGHKKKGVKTIRNLKEVIKYVNSV